jgi:hypothetical protein
MREHWFWWLLTMAVMVWYSTITVYVSVRGSMDIKCMLARLKENAQNERQSRADKSE